MKNIINFLLFITCAAILVTNIYVIYYNKTLFEYNEQLRNDNILLLESYEKLLKAMYVEENY